MMGELCWCRAVAAEAGLFINPSSIVSRRLSPAPDHAKALAPTLHVNLGASTLPPAL